MISHASVIEIQNPLIIVRQQLEEVRRYLDLSPAAYQLLSAPIRELHFQIPVRMDDGRVRVFPGYRVMWNDARGPAKGGLRFHPDETIDTVRALAAWMAWKTAVLDLPLGGGKGGIICSPKAMSTGEMERMSRGYMRAVASFVGPDRDVPAPDVYTNAQVMAWMLDEYEVIQGRRMPGVITGKPVPLGGSVGRHDATARGAIVATREAARVLELNLSGQRAAIQGYGNAGSFAHKLAAEILGLKVVAVSDSQGGIYDPDGLAYEQVIDHKRRTGTVVGFPDTKHLSNQDLLALDVAVLYPAALENVITGANAGKVHAKLLVELANGPTTPEADRILIENGVFVVPDILANAGGVTVSYFEQVQNAASFPWDEEKVHGELDKRMRKACESVYHTAKAYGIFNNRLAAQIVAIQRVSEAMQLRGWV